MSLPLEVQQRFWELAVDNGPGACWGWLGHFNGPMRYGMFVLHGQRYRAHRVSYELHRGPIPEGLSVCHECDFPSCSNPAHLFVGTYADNNRDRDSKGRGRLVHREPGESNWAAKLTPRQVAEIRERYLAGGISQVTLAHEYGVVQPHISRIVRGVNWDGE